MYAEPAIRFGDPFGSNTTPNKTIHQHLPYLDFNRALTPPPEMNGAVQASKSGYYQPEHATHYGDYVPSNHASRAPAAHCLPQEVSNTEFGQNGVQPRSRPMSPAMTSRQTTVDDTYSQHKREPQASAIAPSFQIPKSVNDSGGSLSELAAQITCLFWFESSDLLQQIEESPIPLHPPRQLVADAKPTTGFRKWVTTILSTTLVAQNVVLLALLFVHRLKKLNPAVKGKPGSEYRLLTVALMLGNKFLDDNTYTNKTWAEVSGINVNEVHIMEVEFLSNMKYCLFTSAEDWAKWQSLLGKFANFFERASRPPPRHPPAPILPPASSLHLRMALPSPPASNQASPPYVNDANQNLPAYGGQYGPTPAPSPLTYMPNGQASHPTSRKRSHEDYATEPPAKRVANNYQNYHSPQYYASGPQQPTQSQPTRATLPSLANTVNQAASGTHAHQPASQAQQLPPLQVPARAMAMVYPNASSQPHLQQMSALAGPSSQPPSQYQSRQQSPYPGSATASPSRHLPLSATTLQPPIQVSPTYFLQQRNSPYRPVHNVSTLLYPPTTNSMQNQPQNVEYNQMHYQPLGKPIQQAQSGRLPYVSQNVWLGGDHQQSMTPVLQWPGFNHARQHHPIPQQ
ncbi:uncharacterized protein LTR77_007392 [Saxophila tyrrhenica]|uniref:Uncharacterized protein n=1 Tax=Saxophila tyrrhenica TaxID=1690608 RepID=A0AAV9P4L0_9PEZI|nr:hypothetical protein LTR77_007392 [Saxophila tyrrhenica]